MSKPADLLERIPDPQTIKARIADAVGEAALLRRMLRLSEQRERYQRVAAQRSPELHGVDEDAPGQELRAGRVQSRSTRNHDRPVD